MVRTGVGSGGWWWWWEGADDSHQRMRNDRHKPARLTTTAPCLRIKKEAGFSAIGHSEHVNSTLVSQIPRLPSPTALPRPSPPPPPPSSQSFSASSQMCGKATSHISTSAIFPLSTLIQVFQGALPRALRDWWGGRGEKRSHTNHGPDMLMEGWREYPVPHFTNIFRSGSVLDHPASFRVLCT